MTRTYMASGLLVSSLLGLGCRSQEQQATSPVVAVRSAHESYLKENASGYDWFANASDGFSGVPLILLRALPELAPEIWGAPEEHFSRFGFLPNPEKPDGALPLGLSWDSMDPAHPPDPKALHPVALTCGACHIGRVRLDNGGYLTLTGAPNTQFDVRKWRRAFELTVHKLLSTPEDIKTTADRLRKVISERPANYFFANQRGVTDQVEAAERQALLSTAGGRDVAAMLLTEFRVKILLGELAVRKQRPRVTANPTPRPLMAEARDNRTAVDRCCNHRSK